LYPEKDLYPEKRFLLKGYLKTVSGKPHPENFIRHLSRRYATFWRMFLNFKRLFLIQVLENIST
jgi:hypothetical protein